MSEVQGNNAESGSSTAWQIIGRLIAAAVVLAITAFFTPGFYNKQHLDFSNCCNRSYCN